jgi:hypothetical protein
MMYMSIASEAMSQEQLEEILAESKSWNRAHNLSGFLAYVEGELRGMKFCRFIQVLEGPKEEVLGIFECIERDHRHMHVSVVKEGAISNRNFGSWEMGFEKINLDANVELQEFFELDPEALADHGNLQHNMLLDFMKAFYRLAP